MYYIVDRLGNVCAESESKYQLEVLLESWDPEEKTIDELEIISDKEQE